MTGQVILVGAGPGDPELLTVGGRKALEQADVVVYDRLVGHGILMLIPESAEKINVGKHAGRHPVPQEKINEILVQKAREGKCVVRLKGGDPFLFGRGAEELEEIRKAGISYREIPGIPSAISVPAYGGIPVTHRDLCSSLHIITGHQKAGSELNIPFEALVKAGGTLVFLMGVQALPRICQGLMEAGMAADTPAAVIQQGTTPHQKIVRASLNTLPRQAAEIISPAVIVVGPVCKLDFNWYDRLPLRGKHIIVTRPRRRAQPLAEQLRLLGACVTEFPCIETVPVSPCPALEQALDRIDSCRWLAFTSPAGVDALMQYLQEKDLDVRSLGRIHIAAIGPGTDRELHQYGLRADLIPDIYDGDHLGQALCQAVPRGKVLILRSHLGTSALTDALHAGQIPYDDVHIYETRYASIAPAVLQKALEDRPIVTFTSASTVRGFVQSAGQLDLSGITGACLGAQTEQEAKKYGIRTITAGEASMDSLIACIIEGA